MKNEEKTAAQLSAELIRSLPLHSEYSPIERLPIPLFKGILIKETKRKEVETKAKILLPGVPAKNTEPYHEGIVYAVGPLCSEFTRVGLKYQFSSYVDTYFYHDGVEYF